MFPEGKYIHIHTMEQAWDVVNYYEAPENGGYYRQGLTEDKFLSYPFFEICTALNSKLLSGDSVEPGDKSRIIEYDEWVGMVRQEEFNPAPEDLFIKFVIGGDDDVS